MTLLVTGATGFVMSVLGRHWLDTHPEERLVVLDAAAPDAAAGDTLPTWRSGSTSWSPT